jgi:hypothetical protein
MADSAPPADRFSLRRWSQRKLAAARAADAPAMTPAAVVPAAPAAPGVPGPGTAAPLPAPAAMPPARELPAIDTLSLASDFSPFLQPDVDESLRRQALKKLFAQPAFNVMDGLDVYIDDYGKPDPIAPEIVRQLVQGRYLFDPPRTRVNAEGEVEDVPPDEAAAVPETAAVPGAEVAPDALPDGPLPYATAPAAAEPPVPTAPPAAESRS